MALASTQSMQSHAMYVFRDTLHKQGYILSSRTIYWCSSRTPMSSRSFRMERSKWPIRTSKTAMTSSTELSHIRIPSSPSWTMMQTRTTQKSKSVQQKRRAGERESYLILHYQDKRKYQPVICKGSVISNNRSIENNRLRCQIWSYQVSWNQIWCWGIFHLYGNAADWGHRTLSILCGLYFIKNVEILIYRTPYEIQR